MAQATIRVQGLRELHRDFRKMSKDLSRDVDRELKEAAQIVADDARRRLAPFSARSAAGIRPRVRGFGRVSVEQSRRRTTGKRPDWGARQMRLDFLPALRAKAPEVERALDEMLDRLAGRNGFH